jgi:hypothetical protein
METGGLRFERVQKGRVEKLLLDKRRRKVQRELQGERKVWRYQRERIAWRN